MAPVGDQTMSRERDALASISAEHRKELVDLARRRVEPLEASFIVEAYRTLSTALYRLCVKSQR
jgi:hypothetical protein